MEQRIVLQGEDKYIYFIQNSGVGFYLVIPRANQVSIVLNLMDDITDERVKQMICNTGQVMVVPVIDRSILDGVLQNNVEYFNQLDDTFSKIINLAHQILTYNHLEVSNFVYLNENLQYAMFNQWFIKKYEGRVILQKATIESPVIFPEHVETKQVVETVAQPTVTPTLTNEVKTEDEELSDMLTEDVKIGDVEATGKDFGFVSYVLLGVVVAVVSLVFLYFLI